jgi:hypothetical protein
MNQGTKASLKHPLEAFMLLRWKLNVAISCIYIAIYGFMT